MQNVKRRLEEMREEILDRHSRLAKKVGHREEPLPADFSDQAVELENEETMLQLYNQSKVELVNFQIALERLEAGNYASCSVCGNEIEPERHESLPTTTYCISCARKQ